MSWNDTLIKKKKIR